MKLLDKLILLNRQQKELPTAHLDFMDYIHDTYNYYSGLKKFYKNTDQIDNILKALTQLSDDLEHYNKQHFKFIDSVDKRIRHEEVNIIRRNYEHYEREKLITYDIVAERNGSLSSEALERIKVDIARFTDWRYAGLELFPADGQLTQQMIGCDPLYLYSGHFIETDKIAEKFNDFFFDKRLLIYNNYEDLPQGQIGFACSVNHYEYLPLDPIKDEIVKVRDLLMPGGYFLFTFNDCEHIPSLDFCTNFYRSFNTKSRMIAVTEGLGLEVEYTCDHNGAWSWLVCRKPGKFKTIKQSAPMVQVIEKNT